MIVSASRRTDVPALYAPWLRARLAAGFCLVANPFNAHQVRRVSLVPEDVTALVFWTKFGEPLRAHLPDLDRRGYVSYFQWTLVGYPRLLERRTPPPVRALAALQAMADLLGPDRVVWRYDPVVLGRATDADWHRANFARLARALAGRVTHVVVSVVDLYRKTRRRLAALAGDGAPLHSDDPAATDALLRDLADCAAAHGLTIESCAEERDLRALGIAPGKCIDDRRLARLGVALPAGKDPGQRPACGCVPSCDLGAPDTCTLGCAYCYAVQSDERARARRRAHDPAAPMLAGHDAPAVSDRPGPAAMSRR